MKKIFLLLTLLFTVSNFTFAQAVGTTPGNPATATGTGKLIKPMIYCSPEFLNFTNNLVFGGGNSPEAVKKWQNFIYKYYNLSLVPTGFFGKITRDYTKKFQLENGLSQVGNVGKLTRAKMLSLCGDPNDPNRFGPQDVGLCPDIYKPVCGDVSGRHECCGNNAPKYCQTVKVACSDPKEKTFSNECVMGNAKAKFLYDGECKTNPITLPNPNPTPISDAPLNCKVWYDGCNTCSRSSVGAPMACTMMACIQGGTDEWMKTNKPVCREYFSSNTNAVMTISGFSGPTKLNTGVSGTWKISASMSDNSQLSYSIRWGDEDFSLLNSAMSAMRIKDETITQNTEFTHTYTKPGTYKVEMSVTALNGKKDTVSTTVTVVGDATQNSDSCKVWFDGCNTCNRSYIGGPLACTRMYCIQNSGAYCRESF